MITAILKSRSPAIRAPILVLCLLLSVLSACSDSGTSASQGNSASPNPLPMAADPKLPVPAKQLQQMIHSTAQPAVDENLVQQMAQQEASIASLRQRLSANNLTLTSQAAGSNASPPNATQERLNELRNDINERDTSNPSP